MRDFVSAKKTAKEPLLHITKRDNIPIWKSLLIRLFSIIVAFVIIGLLYFALIGESPLSIYKSMWNGAFGTEKLTWIMFRDLSILLGIALAVTPAFKMKFWNIGAEGQVLAGVLAAAICAKYLGESLPLTLLLIVMAIASILAGILWAVIPGIFKALCNTNETLFTLMMNYIAMQFIELFSDMWKGNNAALGIINEGQMPPIYNEHLIFLIVVSLLTIFMFVYLKYSKHGYEIAVVGESNRTAKYIGINVKKVIIRTTVLSGAICGIMGFLMFSAKSHTISQNIVDGRGFTAILVSWLAKFNPIVMILTSFLVVFMNRGADNVASDFQLNSNSLTNLVVGLLFLIIIAFEFFINYKIKFRQGKNKKEVKKNADTYNVG